MPSEGGRYGLDGELAWYRIEDATEVRGYSSSRVRSRSATAERAFDAAVALTLLTAMVPLLFLIAVAIKLESRGPVFYRVKRVGYRGRPLMMLKFRKMRDDANGMPLTAKGDHRLTRVGRVLTVTRLDELPQLWDVLRGRMSLVGPRPEDPEFVALHPEAFEQILTVRPGITGLSQLAFANERDLLDEDDLVGDYVRRILPQKIALDSLYARRHRVWLDLRVILGTLLVMLLGKPVSVDRSTARITVRRRPSGADELGAAEADGVHSLRFGILDASNAAETEAA